MPSRPLRLEEAFLFSLFCVFDFKQKTSFDNHAASFLFQPRLCIVILFSKYYPPVLEAVMNLKDFLVIVSLFVAFAFCSCVTSGRNFNSNLSWIKKGKTTMNDVRLVLGEPQAVGSASGTPTWTYGYYNFNVTGEGRMKEVKIFWSTNNTVDSYSFTSSFQEDIDSAKRMSVGNSKGVVPSTSNSATEKPLSDVSRQ